MKLKLLHCYFLCYFILSQVPALAQKENNIWTFGTRLGLDFNRTGPPTYTDSCLTSEGCAAVCHPVTGTILFYSDGFKAYDRRNYTMPNGSGLRGNSSSTQGAAIAVIPGHADSLYYLFTLTAFGSKGYLSYSIVNMNLNGGFGDVVSTDKNILIDSNMSEKMMIAGNCGIQWLITHHQDSNIFYAYNLNTGAFSSPMVSAVGYRRSLNSFSLGEIKASPSFNLIAAANYFPGTVELFDFDVTTGRITNFRMLDSSRANCVYGLDFSADESKLYTGRIDSAKVCQYDLTAGSLAAIKASRYSIAAGKSIYGMRRGPDDMIYLMPASPTNFCRIKSPHLSGAACDYEADFLATSLTVSSCFGFGNYFVPRLGDGKDTLYHSTNINLCVGDSIVCEAPKGYRHYSWYDTDTSLSRTFRSTGIYWVKSLGTCGLRTDTFRVKIVTQDTTYSLALDTALCSGNSISVTAPLFRDSYKWTDGDTERVKTLYPASSLMRLHSVLACHHFIDGYRVRLKADDTARAMKVDTFICQDRVLKAEVPPGRDSFSWSDGNTFALRYLPAPALVVLQSRKHCTVYIDTFRVKGIANDTTRKLSEDTAICKGSSITWAPVAGRESYKWSDGSTVPGKTVSPPSALVLQSRMGCSIFYDTFRVSGIDVHTYSSLTDTPACNGAPLVFSGHAGADTYLWDDGSSGKNRTLEAAPGIYWVKALKGCDNYIDTFRVRDKPFDLSTQQADSNICFRSSAVLQAPAGYTGYLWDAGNTGTDTTLFSNADVTLVARDVKKCRMLQLQYKVRLVHFKSDIPDTAVCNQDQLTLDASIDDPGAGYRWTTGDTTARISISGPGRRIVHIRLNGCTLSDTIEVRGKELKVYIGEDRVTCKDQQLNLQANITDALSYEWSTGDTGPQISVSRSGRYTLTIFKDGCRASDEADISFVNCDNCMAFPNAFTPNNDGINDFFKPLLNCPPQTYDLRIYSRWGQEVFHTVNPVDSWNGQYNGMPADGNVYFYLLKISYQGQDITPQVYKGEVILIR